MQLFFCPKRDLIAGHDKVRTVWHNHKYGLFECLDKKCRGRFTEKEMRRFNRNLPSKYTKIHCPQCGSDNIVLAGYGRERPRFKCEQGHIFT